MERIFHSYLKWEDWKAGMYRPLQQDSPEAEELISLACHLLSSPRLLYRAMSSVSKRWRHASEMNLSHIAINRRAWLGQAACCYEYKVPEHLTKQAWHRLSQDQQTKANAIADKVIFEWEQHHA
jgi:hypothetical protein